MQDNGSRADLTGRRLGEIGQLCLALATSIREHPHTVSTRMLALGLSKALDRHLLALFRLKDRDELETLVKESLMGLKKDLHEWLDGEVPAPEATRKLAGYGYVFFDEYWGLADRPRDLLSISAELRKLRDVVCSYRPDDPLVVAQANWIAGVISGLFHPNLFDLSPQTLGAIRDYALAAITFLESIAHHSRHECLTFLPEAADCFSEQAALTGDAGRSPHLNDSAPTATTDSGLPETDGEAAEGSGQTAGTASPRMSLKEFLESSCQWEGICGPDEVRTFAGAWKERLQKAAERDKIQLPIVAARGPRQVQLYERDDLIESWSRLLQYYPQLPPLKPTDPPAA